MKSRPTLDGRDRRRGRGDMATTVRPGQVPANISRWIIRGFRERESPPGTGAGVWRDGGGRAIIEPRPARMARPVGRRPCANKPRLESRGQPRRRDDGTACGSDPGFHVALPPESDEAAAASLRLRRSRVRGDRASLGGRLSRVRSPAGAGERPRQGDVGGVPPSPPSGHLLRPTGPLRIDRPAQAPRRRSSPGAASFPRRP